ncbi:MAG: hypothetical protein AB7F36_05260, partial [Reyranellaceae bacterium]
MSEGRCCDAVIRALEKVSGLYRSNVIYPEIQNQKPPVEVRFSLGAKRYALEHTMIEAFDGQIESDAVFGAFARDLDIGLREALPAPGTYWLTFPLDCTIPRDAIASAKEHLVKWVQEKAIELYNEYPERKSKEVDPRGYRGSRVGRPDHLPFEVRLIREVHWNFLPSQDGVLLYSRGVPADFDIESRRIVRIRRALEKKSR